MMCMKGFPYLYSGELSLSELHNQISSTMLDRLLIIHQLLLNPGSRTYIVSFKPSPSMRFSSNSIITLVGFIHWIVFRTNWDDLVITTSIRLLKMVHRLIEVLPYSSEIWIVPTTTTTWLKSLFLKAIISPVLLSFWRLCNAGRYGDPEAVADEMNSSDFDAASVHLSAWVLSIQTINAWVIGNMRPSNELINRQWFSWYWCP